MTEVRLACQAMATRFEFLLCGEDPVRLRAAGEEAIQEIKRLHDQLSAFRAQSVVSQINRSAAAESVSVTPEIFDLLVRIQRLSQITDGAFDVTVGPLLDLWGFRGAPRSEPDDVELTEVLRRVGMSHMSLDARSRTVSFDQEGIQLDLGGVGKGYALDVAAAVLEAAGVSSALLHGGTSSVRAFGADSSDGPWKVAVRRPSSSQEDGEPDLVMLEDEAMSVSAVSGRFFKANGQVYGHVIDPRNGSPSRDHSMAVVIAPSAVDADALSTGLLVLGAEGIPEISRRVSGFRGAVYV